MTLTRSVSHGEGPLRRSGDPAGLSAMQEKVRDAVRLLVPDKRRPHRQSLLRKKVVAGEAPACARLEQLIDEAIADGVSDANVERLAIAVFDAVRIKLEARMSRPLGVPALSAAIREEEAIEGEMNVLEVDALTSRPTPSQLRVLRWYYFRHIARARDCIRAIDLLIKGRPHA